MIPRSNGSNWAPFHVARQTCRDSPPLPASRRVFRFEADQLGRCGLAARCDWPVFTICVHTQTPRML